jgi:hypothetical protein
MAVAIPSPAGARLITSGHPFRICTVLAETEVTHRACSAAEPAAAVFLESHQKTHLESITWPMATLNFKSPHYLFARLGAIVSLRSCQRDQAHPRARVLLADERAQARSLDRWWKVRDRHDPRPSSRAGSATREDQISAVLLAALRWRSCPRSLGQRRWQRHAADVMRVVEAAADLFRASLSRACGQP